jgi:protein-S-isoprenylcysteine O-methyltransferase Ste14
MNRIFFPSVTLLLKDKICRKKLQVIFPIRLKREGYLDPKVGAATYLSSGFQKEQKVVEAGPYRLIRNPSCTGVLIVYVGIGLAVQSLVAVLMYIAIFGIVYGHRFFVEEEVLINELGNSYVDYMKRTKRIIPYLV